jgi:GNAT superfamily N-acetyltransferase
MENLLIRPAVSPDIEFLSNIEHCVKTDRVWQISNQMEDDNRAVNFSESHLPREMRLTYPYSPEMLPERWKNYSAMLVGCVDNIPVGYISMISYFSPNLVWIKDLVVDEIYRRKGIATSLLQSGVDWKNARGIARMMMEMSSKNFPAICFAKKMGFEFSGFNDYFFSNHDIAIFFSK